MKKSFFRTKKRPKISEPRGFQHKIHIDFDPETGFSGLPEEWLAITNEDQLKGINVQVDELKVKPVKPSPQPIQQIADEKKEKKRTGTLVKLFSKRRLTDPEPKVEEIQPVKIEEPKKEEEPTPLVYRKIVGVLPDENTKKYLVDFINTKDPRTEFTKLERIGSGSTGLVYRAIHKPSRRKCAIKIISITKETKLDMFENEIKMMASLNHKNVCNYITSYATEHELWIVMEYIDGCSLTDLLHTQMTESEIACILRESLKALEYIHAEGIIHRDVKSDNILIMADGRVKLADFGFTCRITPERPKRRSVVGTPYWMAPEVVRGTEYDTLADIWSLGVMALEMADGVVPRLDLPPIKALFVISTEPPPELEDPDDWSDEFKDFLACCLVKDVSLRKNATELLQHPFIRKASSTSFLVPLIQRIKKEKQEKKQAPVKEESSEEEDDDDDDDDDEII